MTTPEVNVITGAFSYTGKYITRRLLSIGSAPIHPCNAAGSRLPLRGQQGCKEKEVRTLTGHPNNPSPFGDAVKVFPFNFDRPRELVKSLQGATTLYNTYWIRFAHGSMTFDKAVENTKTLIQAAEEAGVRRIVHVSITNPAETSRLPYFRGKAMLEQAIKNSTLSYAIIRPTVIFGNEDILINNIAWLLRHFPLFPLFGSGNYSLQPIYVEDMADLVIKAGQQDDNTILDAVGPDVYTFEELVRFIAGKLHRKVIITHVSPGLAFSLAKLIEPLVGDV